MIKIIECFISQRKILKIEEGYIWKSFCHHLSENFLIAVIPRHFMKGRPEQPHLYIVFFTYINGFTGIYVSWF